MTITKKTVNGKEQITSCSLKDCCLTVIELETDPIQLKLSNEKGQVLICSLEEFKEAALHILLTQDRQLNSIETHRKDILESKEAVEPIKSLEEFRNIEKMLHRTGLPEYKGVKNIYYS